MALLQGKEGISWLEQQGAPEGLSKRVALVTRGTEEELIEAVRLGIRVFVTVQVTAEELEAAVRSAAESTAFHSRHVMPILSELLEGCIRSEESAGEGESGGEERRENLEGEVLEERPRLSQQEMKAAELAARGLTNRQIAKEMTLEEATVKYHLSKVYRKLHIRRRKEVMKALASYRAGRSD